MTTFLEAHAYRIAIIFATLALVSAAVLLISIVSPDWTDTFWPPRIDENPVGEGAEGPLSANVIISTLSLVAFVIGNAFTVVIGWRKERRDAVESKLRIRQLELQLAQMGATTDSAAE
jgi:hypothetical protein